MKRMFPATNKQRLKDLRLLGQLSSYLIQQMNLVSPRNLSDKQNNVLYDVLRYLDFNNEYSLGRRIRSAFGIELDNKRTNAS